MQTKERSIFSSENPAVVLSVRDVAAFTGKSEFTVREWLRLGLLEHVRQGSRRWVMVAQLRRFLEGVTPLSEPAALDTPAAAPHSSHASAADQASSPLRVS